MVRSFRFALNSTVWLIDTAEDIPSHVYQFSFANNPLWSRFYAGGGEIQDYLKDVAWKYDIEKYVRFRHLFQRGGMARTGPTMAYYSQGSPERTSKRARFSSVTEFKGMLKRSIGQNRPSRYLFERHRPTKSMGLAKDTWRASFQGLIHALCKLGRNVRLDRQNCGLDRFRF